MTATASDCASRLAEALRNPARLAHITLREWDVLLRLAKSSNLIARLAEAVAERGEGLVVPGRVAAHLRAALTLSRHQRQAIGWETQHIATALATLGLPVVALKGSAYVLAGLDAAKGRLFGDIDILVPRQALDQVEAALMQHGWAAEHSDDYDDRYYRRWMHELPPMVHRKRGTVIDIHHNILPTTAKRVPDVGKLFANALPIPGCAFLMLAPTDMVLHSATHLFHEGELGNGLRDLFDLDTLIGHFSRLDADFPAKLFARAEELGLARWLRYAVYFLVETIASPVAIELSAVHGGFIVPPSIRHRVVAWSYKRALQPDHPLCGNGQTSLARWLLYLRGHYLRMPAYLLAPHLARKAFFRLFKSTSRSV
jgi:hypothetical protein